MIKYEKTEGGLRFTFDNSPTYLGNGTIDVPFNSVALVVDDSSMITVRKAASYDILFSATEEELGTSKEQFRTWFEANSTSTTGGGGGGGSVDAYTKAESDARYGTKAEQESLRNDVEQALGEIAELEADKATKEELKNYQPKGDYVTTDKLDDLATKDELEQVKGEIPSLDGYATEKWVEDKHYLTEHQDISDLATKEELKNYQPKGDYATKVEVSAKQDKLVAGENITIEGNVISAVGGGESVDAYVEGHTLYFGKK